MLPVSAAPALNRLTEVVSRSALLSSHHVTLCDVMVVRGSYSSLPVAQGKGQKHTLCIKLNVCASCFREERRADLTD